MRGGPDSNSTQGALFGLTMLTSGLPEAMPESRWFCRLSLLAAKEASFGSLQSDFTKTGVTRWKTREAPLLPGEALEVTPLLGGHSERHQPSNLPGIIQDCRVGTDEVVKRTKDESVDMGVDKRMRKAGKTNGATVDR